MTPKKERIYPRENMTRTVKWLFCLPLVFTFWLLVCIFIPNVANNTAPFFLLSSLRYIIFIAMLILSAKKFLKFEPLNYFRQERSWNNGLFFSMLGTMIFSQGLVALVSYLLNPETFTFSFNSSAWLSILLSSLLLFFFAALQEELIFRSYVAFFLKDSMPSSTKEILIYSLVSGVLFSIAHFENPETKTALFFIPYLFYFSMGFVLMVFTLKTRGIEVALGAHLGNNLFSGLILGYDNSLLKANPIWTQKGEVDFVLLVQTFVCLLICAFVLKLYSKKMGRKKENG